MSKPKAPLPGQDIKLKDDEFDPENCGFFPGEIVDRETNLTQAEKHLYWRIVHWIGQNKECWYSFEGMAKALGYKNPATDKRQVRRHVRALEQAGLIRVTPRYQDGKQLSNTYRCLRHPLFDSLYRPAAAETREDKITLVGRTKLSGRGDKIDTPGRTKLPPESFRESSTESDRESSRSKPTNPPSKRTEHWWTDEQLDHARTALGEHRGCGNQPDVAITRRTLSVFTSIEEFDLWLEDVRTRLRPEQVRSYGLYPKDAQTWTAKHREAETAERRHRDEHARTCKGIQFGTTGETIAGTRYNILHGYPCEECAKGQEVAAKGREFLDAQILAEVQRRGGNWLTNYQAFALERETRARKPEPPPTVDPAPPIPATEPPIPMVSPGPQILRPAA